MADTTTTNYGLVKPELKSVGWGEKINDDLDAIDAQMRLNEVSASDKVPLTRTVNSKALSANIVLTTADVADSADKRYCTDAQKTAIGTIPVKATGAEADTGTNDDKFLTAKAAKDSHNIPSVAPGTIGNVLTSDGTDWTSSAPATAGIESVVAGTNVTVDDTDPANPVVSATVTDASLTTTDVTTNNASTSKHGFLKKLSNVATEFMNGVGNWVSMTINDLLPSQTGNSGKFLTTNGSSASWGAVASSGYSNVLFQWYGLFDEFTNDVYGSQRPDQSSTIYSSSKTVVSVSTYQYRYVKGTTYRSVLVTKFIKTSGVSTVTVYARVYRDVNTGYVKCLIGNASGEVTATGAAGEWVTFTIDVSGLTNGTVYDVAVQLKSSHSENACFMSAVIAFGS